LKMNIQHSMCEGQGKWIEINSSLLQQNFMKKIVFVLSLIMAINFSVAQDPACKVLQASLIGTYKGDCNNGKAHGQGKAVGTDTYDGSFKNGLPDGAGTYSWKNGHYFTGQFRKGIKEGKGEMHYKAADGSDSAIAGFWKKDKYIGEYEKDYVVISNTSHISKVECSLQDKGGDNIKITIHKVGGAGSGKELPYIGNISVVAGTFENRNDQVLTSLSSTSIQQVNFPFRAIFYLSNGENTEILFNAKGNYEVYIDIL